MTETSTAQDQARFALRGATGETLLKSFASLTHRIHEARAWVREARTGRDRNCAVAHVQGLNLQRDLVEAEILRRMGDGS